MNGVKKSDRKHSYQRLSPWIYRYAVVVLASVVLVRVGMARFYSLFSVSRQPHGSRAGFLVLSGCLIAFAFPRLALAGETVITVTPAGGNDVGAALLPPPGLYGALAFVPAFGSGLRDPNGKEVKGVDASQQAFTWAGVVQYVYPFEVFGGRVSTLLQVPFSRAHVKIDPVFNESATGFGDLYVDAVNWSRHIGASPKPTDNPPWSFMPLGFTVSAGLAIKVPTGHYDSDRQINEGYNLWIFSPNVGLTYLSPPNSFLGSGPWEISARAYYSILLRNSKTHYRGGQAFNIDWAVAKYVLPKLEIGISGIYQQQTTADDRPDGYPPAVNGNRFGTARIGPVVAYRLPDGLGLIKVKYFLPNLYTANGIVSQALIISWGRKFL